MSLLQMLLLVWIMPGRTYGHIGCAAVAIAGETTVICLFGKNISQKGFSVHRYHTSGSGGELVLACNRQASGDLICDKRGDTQFDENQSITNELTLTKPTLKDTQGVLVQYLCEVVPSEKDIVQRCNVTYKALPAITSATTTKANTFSQEMDDTDPLDVAVLVLIILVTFTVMVICVTCYIMRKRCLYDIIRKTWVSAINECWPGAIGDEEDQHTISSVDQSSSAAVSWKREMPKGLPDFFYNLGVEDTMKEEERKRAALQKEHREQEQQNQDKAQPEARPKKGGFGDMAIGILAGRGPKQDAQKEQKNKKGKRDPDKETNQMESASPEDPMLHDPPSTRKKSRHSGHPSGAAAQGHDDEEFFDATSGESSPNEDPAEKRPAGKKKTGIMKRMKQKLAKKKGKEDKQLTVPRSDPQRAESEATDNKKEEMPKQTTVV